MLPLLLYTMSRGINSPADASKSVDSNVDRHGLVRVVLLVGSMELKSVICEQEEKRQAGEEDPNSFFVLWIDWWQNRAVRLILMGEIPFSRKKAVLNCERYA
jgi:hypothetical protein